MINPCTCFSFIPVWNNMTPSRNHAHLVGAARVTKESKTSEVVLTESAAKRPAVRSAVLAEGKGKTVWSQGMCPGARFGELLTLLLSGSRTASVAMPHTHWIAACPMRTLMMDVAMRPLTHTLAHTLAHTHYCTHTLAHTHSFAHTHLL